jgi:hypothetical protein
VGVFNDESVNDTESGAVPDVGLAVKLAVGGAACTPWTSIKIKKTDTSVIKRMVGFMRHTRTARVNIPA